MQIKIKWVLGIFCCQQLLLFSENLQKWHGNLFACLHRYTSEGNILPVGYPDFLYDQTGLIDVLQQGFLFTENAGNRMQEITQHKFGVFLDNSRQL